jgi:sarcosine oxidase subunit beta
MTSVAVIGSGIIGASIAYHLAIRGAKVTLIDRALPATAPSASWASAGGLRSQGRAAAEHAIARAASRRWPDLPAELDADLGVVLGGHLHVAETEAEAFILQARIDADRAGGIEVELLDASGIAALVPGLTGAAVAGAWTPGDGQANPALAANAFARAAQRAGAQCVFGSPATPVIQGQKCVGARYAGGEMLPADSVVLAAGAWCVAMLADLGLPLPLSWLGLQMVSSAPVPPMLRATVTAVGRNLSLKQTPSGEIMIGGRWFARPCGEAPEVEAIPEQVGPQWQSACGVFPRVSELSIGRVWAGAEAQSPDGLPFIGRVGPAGLYLAAGFSNHGFQIAPAIGDCVADDILLGAHALLTPFHPDRFHQRADTTKTRAFG